MSRPCRFCKPKSHRDLGFTDEEFLEIVDFFRELMRLDQKGKQLEAEMARLVAVLRTRTRQLVEVEKSKLMEEIRSLEELNKI